MKSLTPCPSVSLVWAVVFFSSGVTVGFASRRTLETMECQVPGSAAAERSKAGGLVQPQASLSVAQLSMLWLCLFEAPVALGCLSLQQAAWRKTRASSRGFFSFWAWPQLTYLRSLVCFGPRFCPVVCSTSSACSFCCRFSPEPHCPTLPIALRQLSTRLQFTALALLQRQTTLSTTTHHV
jgi:hypothetical protein